MRRTPGLVLGPREAGGSSLARADWDGSGGVGVAFAGSFKWVGPCSWMVRSCAQRTLLVVYDQHAYLTTGGVAQDVLQGHGAFARQLDLETQAGVGEGLSSLARTGLRDQLVHDTDMLEVADDGEIDVIDQRHTFGTPPVPS